jgi:tRNA-specific 2-thiouridylase
MFTDNFPDRITGKVRYAHKSAACSAKLAGGLLHVTFEEPQESITPGQSIVLYDGDMVIGGGIIKYATQRSEDLPGVL